MEEARFRNDDGIAEEANINEIAAFENKTMYQQAFKFTGD